MDRFLRINQGPVPVTRELSPDSQAVFRTVNAELLSNIKTKKRGPYFKWEDRDRFELGKIAVLDGNSAALKAAKKINPACIDSTIRVFKRKYQQ